MSAVEYHLEPVERVLCRRYEVRHVVFRAVDQIVDASHLGTDRTRPLLVQQALDGVFDFVGQLVPARGEELDSVVGHGIVARRDHHAQVGVHLGGQVSHPGRGQNPNAHNVCARAREPGRDGGLEHLTAGARIAADQC